jgi:hypothetical protein
MARPAVADLRPVAQIVVGDDARHHGFADRHARMPTHGSWRPLVTISVSLP